VGCMAKEYRLTRGRRGHGVRIDYAAELNEAQHAAVSSGGGAALVIAGAGSGKTRTLTYRVAYLLEQGVEPSEILLLTFTNKAAREMLERVAALAGGEVFGLWGGTFHSVGARILRRHAEQLGLGSNFSILDREDQKSLIGGVVGRIDVPKGAGRFPKPEVVANLFSLAANTGRGLAEVVEESYPYFEHYLEVFEEVRKGYEAKKRGGNSVDFDDLLLLPLQLLGEDEQLAKSYQQRFRHVLVDEYQDTNLVQSELVDLLAGGHGNLMVVGDDAQSIYSWRGADLEHIVGFAGRYPGAAVYRIETNYRSTPEVLALANASIGNNLRQIPKELRASREVGGMRPALVSLGSPQEQAAFVVQRILELRDEEGIEPEEIAVLYRAHFQSLEVQLELTAAGVPFDITSGLRFFEQAHIKDVAAFLRVAVNPLDEVSFKRMVMLLPGVGAAGADKLFRGWLAAGMGAGVVPESYSDVLLGLPVPARAKEGWEQLAWTMDEFVGEAGELAPPSALIRSVLEGVYDEQLKAIYPNYDVRRQDILTLAGYSEGFETAADFLGQVSLLAGADVEVGGREERAGGCGGKVTLSSVHQAKGLEWRAVFVIAATEGMFPNGRVLESGGEAALEEERRLFYVAVTRAKDELYLCYPRVWRSSYQGDVWQVPSRFLGEVPGGLMEEWSVGGGY
jgi:DNA helicase II / ATP-dependent DNA helicase PcrA